MTAYLVRRLLAVIPVMAVVVTVVFLLIHLIPGDPVSVMLGPDATPAQIEGTRQALGLDRPLHEQLLLFYARVLRGDLGQSYFLDRPVTTALWERAEPTLVLTVCALLVAVVDRRALGHRGRRPPGLAVGPRAHDGRPPRRLRPRLLAEPQLHLPLRGAPRAGCPPRATPRSSPTRGPRSATWCCRRSRSASTSRPSSRASRAPACSRCSSRTTSAPPGPRGCPQRVGHLRARLPQRAGAGGDRDRHHHRDPHRRRGGHGDRVQHPRAGPPHHLGHPAARLSRWCRGSCW